MPEPVSPDLDQASAPRRGIRGFVARNRDELALEIIGGVILALVVSLVVFGLDQVTTDRRDAQSEALSNSIFVRQAVMNDRAVLPFSSLNLRDAQLSGLPLAGADFSDADLSNAELKNADFTGANFTEANLTSADLSGSILIDADLSEALLRGTDLSGVDFTGATVTAVDFSDARYVDGDPPTGLADLSGLRVVADESDSDDND